MFQEHAIKEQCYRKMPSDSLVLPIKIENKRVRFHTINLITQHYSCITRSCNVVLYLFIFLYFINYFT